MAEPRELGFGVGSVSTAEVVMMKVADEVLFDESLTWTVKVAVPAVVGTPDTTPAGETLRFKVARLFDPVAPEVTVQI